MMGLSRVAVHRAATLTHTWYVGETPTDPTGTPTYAIVDANGTAVSSGNATVVGGSSGQTTAPLAAQSLMRHLTVTWVATVAGGSVTEVDYVEVVGGFFFTLAEGRASNSALSSTSTYPTAALEAARLEVEVECEEICDRAFVPRYRRVVVDGSGTGDLALGVADVRSIRRAAMADSPDGTFTDLTAAQLAAVAVRPDRTLRRTDGNVWTEGTANIVVEVEYGLDRPPVDLVDGSQIRFRTLLTRPKSAIPDRAQSFVVGEGGTFRIAQPGPWETGIPEVDAAYDRYSLRERMGPNGSGLPVPASRTLQFAPQRHSLFHR
jgi:hypothetical protein